MPRAKQPIEGVDKEALVEGLRARGHRRSWHCPTRRIWPRWYMRSPGMATLWFAWGPGNITHWAAALPEQLGMQSAGARAGRR